MFDRSHYPKNTVDMVPPVPHSFRVPEPFDNTSSEPSREGSVQIMESHIRAFSVPSGDEGSESESDEYSSMEIASVNHSDGQKRSAVTTPEQDLAQKQSVDKSISQENEATPSKMRSSNLDGPKLPDSLKPSNAGSSQQDPIDLEGDASGKRVIDSESEDDGPEILPTRHSLPADDSDQEEFYLTRKRCRSPVVHEDNNGIEPVVHETQSHACPNKEQSIEQDPPPKMHYAFVDEADDGLYSDEDENDDFSREDSSSSYDEEDMENLSTKSMPPSTASVLSRSDPKEAKESQRAPEPPLAPILHTVNPSHVNISISNPTDVSRSSFAGYVTTAPRAPSPSDAALAKKFSDSVPILRSQQPLENQRGSEITRPLNAPHRVAGEPTFIERPFGPSYFESFPMSSPDDANTYPKSYVDGPFSTNPNFTITNHPPVTSGFFPNDDYNGYQTFPFTEFGPSGEPRMPDYMGQQLPEYDGYPNIEEDARFAAKLQAEEDSLASASSVPVETSVNNHVSSQPRKASEGQSSKINIASLVNDPHVESSKSRKRKAEDISTMSTEEEALLAPRAIKPNDNDSIRVVASYSYDDHGNETGVMLPDAQITETPHYSSSTPLTQDDARASAIKATSTQTVTAIKEPEEPARKKVRTSKRPTTTSTGIGKFVSGVCVGLVGAFAAFVATIPASVREEALREMSGGV